MINHAGRRQLVRRLAVAAVAVAALAGCASGATTPAPVPTSTPPQVTADRAQAAAVDKVVQDAMRARHLKAAIVRVTVDGKEVLTQAYGESMSGVPATVDMHFRNGAMAISYVSTLLLVLVDEKKLALDDKASKWVPEIPHSDEVTLRQLAQMTSGYPDYVIGNAEFGQKLYADPFHPWTQDEILQLVASKPLYYPPGTNWNYAHTNYQILGLALERATGRKMADLLHEKVLQPLALMDTVAPGTPAVPEPALHSFTSERRGLGIPADVPFYEDSTFWNPSWTINPGAVQTTTIADAAATAVGIGEGKLLSPESYRAMISTGLRGTNVALPVCQPTCFPQNEVYSYGLGIVTTGNWLQQVPLFAGEAGAFAYLPSKKIAIALVVTFTPEAFGPDGSYVPEVGGNAADQVWREIGAALAPDDPPPPRRS